jgi:hypothetical protein
MAAVTAARVIIRPLGAKGSAGVLPQFPAVVPMEAELGQGAGDFLRLLLPELNPNPPSDNVGNPPELRGLVLQQVQQPPGGQLPVAVTQPVIQPGQLSPAGQFPVCRIVI